MIQHFFSSRRLRCEYAVKYSDILSPTRGVLIKNKLSGVLWNAVMDYAVNNLGLSKKFYRRRDPYNWSQVGKVRSKLLNDGTIRSCFEAYFKILGFDNSNIISHILSVFTPKELSGFSSFLNQLAKNEFSKIMKPEYWSIFCDIGSLVGYPGDKDRIFKQDIPAWLTTGPKSTVEQQANFNLVSKAIFDIMGSKVTETTRWRSFRDWVLARHTWMNQGASRYSKLEVDGKKMRSKFGSALSLTDGQLLQICDTSVIRRDGLKAFVKRDEKGIKGRYVINVPFGLYLRQKYLLDSLLEMFPMIDRRLMFFTDDVKVVEEIQSRLHNYYVAVPLDFDSFDSTIEPFFFEAWFDFLLQILSGEKRKMALIEMSLFKSIPVRDEKGKAYGLWNRGLPSGLFTTASLGSLFNLVGQKIVTQNLFGVSPGFAKGDDSILFGLQKHINMLAISKEYRKLGLQVNPEKNWVTPGVTELLKMIITEDSVDQYPARIFSSLLWSYPGDPLTAPTKVERFVSTASLWKEFFDRSYIENEDLMVNDLSQMISGLPIRKKTIKEWVHTPPFLGGFGLLPLRFNFKFKFNTVRVEREIKNNIFDYPLEFVKLKGLSFTKVDLSSILNTSKHTYLSLTDLYGVNPTWRQYIKYLKLGMERDSDLPTLPKKFSLVKQKTNLPFRVIGVSDFAISSLFPLRMKQGLTKECINYVLIVLKEFNNWNSYTRFLIK